MTGEALAYVVDDPAAATSRLASRGIPRTVTAATCGLTMAQYDVRPELGFAVEFAGLFEKVRTAADGWDRTTFRQPFG